MISPLKWKPKVGNKIHAVAYQALTFMFKELRKQNKTHTYTQNQTKTESIWELALMRRSGGDGWGQLTLEWRLWRQTLSLLMSTLSSSLSEINYISILGSIHSDHQVTWFISLIIHRHNMHTTHTQTNTQHTHRDKYSSQCSYDGEIRTW